ncbi:MAG: hypothetical protein KatS3mg016_0108 [Fimbriimonadales bacterium]|nr:MAG: hypothetical protein KatS3mg016_0108 [Fimbriimonadales bacterium]
MAKRESGRVLGILVVLLLLAGLGVGAWYFLVYTKSPQYALNQFFEAAKANDTQKVEQYIDKSGAIVGMISAAAAMNPNMAGADPVRAIYPGYLDASLGQTQKVTIESISVEGDTAKAKVVMEVAIDGKVETIKPTYVLKKTENGWKVQVQDTMFGSFNQFVTPRARQMMVRQLRAISNSPMGAMAKAQLQGIRAEIDKYPEFAAILKQAGLL